MSDYSGAALAMDDRDLLQIMMGGAYDLPELPAAVVANDSMCNALYRASITAAWAGRWRYVCRDASLALAWAHDRRDARAPGLQECRDLR